MEPTTTYSNWCPPAPQPTLELTTIYSNWSRPQPTPNGAHHNHSKWSPPQPTANGAHQIPLQLVLTTTHSKWSPPNPTPIGAHHNGVLQFPGVGTEAVEDLVFTEAVEPFSSGGRRAGHEISSLSLSRAETTDNLQERRKERERLEGEFFVELCFNRAPTCPCAFMIVTVFVLLHTTNCSFTLGKTWTLLMVTSS